MSKVKKIKCGKCQTEITFDSHEDLRNIGSFECFVCKKKFSEAKDNHRQILKD